MRRIIAGLSLIWTVAVAAFVLVFFFPWIHTTDGITKNMSYTESEDKVYVSENVHDHAVIYKLADDGGKDDIFIGRDNYITKDYKVNAVAYEQSLLVLFSYDTVYEGRDITVYRIARLDDKMTVAQLSDYLVLGDEIHITYMSADEKDIYISAVNTSRSEAYVYQVSQDALKTVESRSGLNFTGVKNKISRDKSEAEQDEAAEAFEEISPFEFQVADAGRIYADCVYEPGELHIRYDNEKESGYFSIPKSVKTAYGNMLITGIEYNEMRGISLVWIVILWLLGIPVIVIITIIMNGRNHVVYIGAIMELVLFIIFAGGTCSVIMSASSLSNSEHTSYTGYIMNEAFSNLNFDTGEYDFTSTGSEREDMLKAYYDSSMYESMYKQLKNMVSLPEDNWKISGMAVVNVKSKEVLVSDTRMNRVLVSELYGEKAGKFTGVSNGGNNLREETISSDGGKCQAIARSLDGIGLSGYCLVALVDYQDSFKNAATEFKNFVKTAVIVYIISSIAILVLLYFENRDMHAVARMLKLLAEGRGVMTNPSVRGKDLVSMKNSAFEIDKNITSMNHTKYKIFEAYYRFAPKSIEVMLDKASITEVEIGDMSDIAGTIAILSMKDKNRTDKESLAYMNKTFAIMENSRDEYGGIYISNNENLSRARFLFPDNNNSNAVGFGIEVLNSIREWKKRENIDSLVMLHHTTFSYGICGTDTQSMALLTSEELEKLSSVAKWLRGLRVSMVITETVLEREDGLDDIRYIGFINIVANDRLKLYEVLGAHGNREADVRKKNKDDFEEAIRLFYAKDFYLARNIFTDILRETPEDGLAKWYLFECEEQLNETADDIFTGALHI